MIRTIYDPSRGQRVPVHVWSSELKADTERQLVRIASQPWVVSHVAAMADAHVAEGVSVGTVFATENAVIPAALGGDLGCGMRAARFAYPASSLDRKTLERIVAAFGRSIPAGEDTQRGRGAEVPEVLMREGLSTRALDHARESLARRHLATLGGGNHFLELDRDEVGDLWAIVHTGSRGLGAVIAKHHREAARAGDVNADGALASLDATRDAGAAYLHDVTWALSFAKANREAILRRAAEVLADIAGAGIPCEEVDVHHNFVAREDHAGRALLVHRKGATHATEGATGIIPGSMGTATYLVRGLGCEAAFASCSHGAGRVMTRSEARERVKPRALEHAMRRVVFDTRRAGALVEEAPEVYRDIRAVLDDQRDLVEPVQRLEPIAVYKG